MDSIRKELTGAVRHWWVYPILGAFFILMSVFVISRPVTSYALLVYYFVFTFLVSGIFRIGFALTNRKRVDSWGWYFAGGIFDVLIGLMLVNNMGSAALILPIYVGFFLMFSSVGAVSKSIDLKELKLEGWAWLMTLGVLGMIFSVFLLMHPVFIMGTIVVWTSLGFLTTGIFYIYLGFRFHKVNHNVHDFIHA